MNLLKRITIYDKIVLFFTFFVSTAFAGTPPAAERHQDPIEVKTKKKVSKERKGIVASIIERRLQRKTESFTQSRIHRKKSKKAKVKRRDEWYSIALGGLGMLVALTAFILGIILFSTIGWWAVLIAFGGIAVGTGICAIGSAVDCCGRMSGLGAAIMGILTAVGGLFGMMIWGLIGFLVWLF